MGLDNGFLSSRHCKSGIGLWVLQYICRGAQRGDQAASAAATNRRHQAGSSRVSTQVAWSRLMYCLEFAVDSELIRRSPCPTGKDGKRRTGLPSLGPSRSRSVLTADELAAIGEVTSTDVAYGPGRPEQLRSHTRDDHRINLQGRSKFHEGRDAVAVDNTMDPLAWLRKHPEYGGAATNGLARSWALRSPPLGCAHWRHLRCSSRCWPCTSARGVSRDRIKVRSSFPLRKGPW